MHAPTVPLRTAAQTLQAIEDALDRVPVRDTRRLRPSPEDHDLYRLLLAMGAPLHILPWPPTPRPMAVLLMDRETRRRLAHACGVAPGPDWGSQIVMYSGVPIQIDDDADGRVYLVSLRSMEGDD